LKYLFRNGKVEYINLCAFKYLKEFVFNLDILYQLEMRPFYK